MRRRSVINCALLLALTLAAGSCAKQAPQKAPKSYNVLTVALSDTSIGTRYSTKISGEQYVEIRPQITGVITKILINEGASIKKGQSLFIIDQTPYKAALDVAVANVKSANAAVATAKLNAESAADLYDAKVISQNELQVTLNTLLSAEAALALAVAQEVNARNNLSYTDIKSPVDGVASMIPYRVGALVSPTSTDPLVSVSDNDRMYAYFSMSESRVLSHIRQSGSTKAMIESLPDVELILSDGESYDHLGKVDAISGTIDKSTGTVSIRAIFDNPSQMLRDGASGRVILRTEYKDAMVIPKVATFEVQERIFVYKVIDGVAKSAEIKVVPIDNGSEYIVTSGISVGDVLIAEGAGLVRENTPIIANK